MKAKSKKATKVAVAVKPAARKRARAAAKPTSPAEVLQRMIAELRASGEWTVTDFPTDGGISRVLDNAIQRMAEETNRRNAPSRNAREPVKIEVSMGASEVQGCNEGERAQRHYDNAKQNADRSTTWTGAVMQSAAKPAGDGLSAELGALNDELARLRLNLASLHDAIAPVCGPISDDVVAPIGPTRSPLCESVAGLRRQVTDAANVIRNITAAIAL